MVNLPTKKRTVWCAWICVLCVIFALFGNTAEVHAAGNGRIYGSTITAEQGEEVTVSFAISDNPGIWGLKCTIRYDTSAMTLKSASAGTVFAENEILLPEDISQVPFSFLATGSAISNISGNGVILSLTFVINANAPHADYSVDIRVDQAINTNEKDVTLKTAAGKITVVSCVHRYTYLKNVLPATESTEGYTGDEHCRKCDVLIKQGSAIPVIVIPCEHKNASWHVVEEPTCRNDGYQEYLCDDCGKFLDDAAIKKTGHDKTVIRDQKPATMTEEGYTGNTYCEKCDTLLKEGTVIPKIQITVFPMTLETNDTYYKADSKGLVFISEADLDTFVRVEINSSVLDEKYYTLESGSTKVTLKPEYLDTLAYGKYTITIVSEAGTASAQFLVAENAPSVFSNPWIWVIILVAVAVVIGAVTYVLIIHAKKKQQQEV